jgi:hypothetical protein
MTPKGSSKDTRFLFFPKSFFLINELSLFAIFCFHNVQMP